MTHDGFVDDDDDDDYDGDGVDELGDGYSDGEVMTAAMVIAKMMMVMAMVMMLMVVMGNLYSSMITASCSSTVSRLCGNRPTCFMSFNSSRVFAAI